MKPPLNYTFASDNTSGFCPEAWRALEEANAGALASYGDDPWTEQASDRIREIFQADCEVFFVFNGTAANSLALASCCQSYHSVICHEHAHILEDECGAPEFFSNGTKLLGAPGAHGKLTPAGVAALATKRQDIHYPKPRVLSLTQSTERGTLYSLAELAALRETAKQHQLSTHLDGARFANAVAALDVSPADLSWRAGIDVLCLGGTKNGMGASEAVIFFNRDLAQDFAYRCKQAGQLASKMRFLAAGWVGLLAADAWLQHARHANRCAQALAEAIKIQTSIEPVAPVEANAIFLPFPPALVSAMRRRGWAFYSYMGEGTSRLMCSWRTTAEEITRFASDLAESQREIGNGFVGAKVA